MASAVIGALRVNLGIDSAQFMDGLAQAQKSLKGIGKSMTKVGAGLSASITAPVVALGMGILRTAGEFEAAMSRVGAATGATAGQMVELEKLSRDLGKSTIFSAQESADAMEVLAKNGLTIEQILGGATQASLDLAAATGSNMAGAADVATDVMLSFNKTTEEMGSVVDGITGVLLASKFGFDDYRLAIGQAGGAAGALGVEFEDFNAALVATSNLFASGSDAGTSFKTFMQRLAPQTAPAREAMRELGLEFFDAQGKLKSMADIAEELKTSLAGLSEEARSEALTTIFGTDAMRTAIGLMGQGADGINRINAELAKASGAEQAAARLGPYAAAIEQLGGAWEEFQLTLADTGFIDTVTQLVTKLTEFINKISESNPQLLQWGVIIAGVGAAIGPVVLTLGLLVTGIAAIGAPIALAIAAFASLVTGIIYFKDEIIAAMEVVNQWTVAVVDGMVAGITSLATSITGFVSGAWAQFVAAWDGMVAKVAEVKAAIVEFAASIPSIFANLASQMVQIGADIIQGLWDGLKSKMSAVKESLVGFASDLKNSVTGFFGVQSPSTVMMEIGGFIMQGLGLGMEQQQSYVVDVATTTAQKAVAATKDAWAGLRDVTTEVKGSFDNLFSSIGNNIAEVIKGTKSFGDAIKDVLGQIASMLIQTGLQGIFGGGGGIGGFFSSLFGGLFGFASGGSFKVGGAGGVDSQLVAFKASPNENVSVTKPGQERHGGVQVSVVSRFDANGNFETVVEDISERTAAPMVQAGMSRANQAVVPTMAQYQNDRSGSDYRLM